MKTVPISTMILIFGFGGSDYDKEVGKKFKKGDTDYYFGMQNNDKAAAEAGLKLMKDNAQTEKEQDDVRYKEVTIGKKKFAEKKQEKKKEKE